MKRVLSCAAFAAIGAAVAVLILHRAGAARPRPRPIPLGTATVSRTDLVSRQQLRGRLTAPARGTVGLQGGGTVTELAQPGELLRRGSAIAEVDDAPVAVLFGAAPLYRTLELNRTTAAQLAVEQARAALLSAQAGDDRLVRGAAPAQRRAAAAQTRAGIDAAGARLASAQAALQAAQRPMQGADVALLTANLAALGFLPGVRDVYDPTVRAAVMRWQRSLGAPVTGIVTPASVVVVPGGSRVTAVDGRIGDSPASVAVSLSASASEAVLRCGDRPPPQLAHGRRVAVRVGAAAVAGRVSTVARTATGATVYVLLSHRPGHAWAGEPVSLTVTAVVRRDALVVPEQALLALAGGGYAVQLPAGRLLAVRTGPVQAGMIGISGPAIRAGLRVVSVS